MTSAVTLLYAHDPKEVIESAMKALQLSLKELSEIIASPLVCDHLTANELKLRFIFESESITPFQGVMRFASNV